MRTKLLILLDIFVQLVDIAVHGASGQLEPLRVIANIVLILSALLVLFMPRILGAISITTGLLLYLILNVSFVLIAGLFNDGALRIGLLLFGAITLFCSLWLARTLRTIDQRAKNK